MSRNRTLLISFYRFVLKIQGGICKGYAKDYRDSTLRGVLNRSEILFPLADDPTFFSDPNGTIEWLNTLPDPDKLEGFRWGLKHQFFTSKKKSARQSAYYFRK
tara:strand:- start:2421 stop:2729 length:309 start_codon:yes stop_codon:yes gene_type:complete